MSPDPKQERDDFEYDPPRSIFAATWFRALLVLIVVGVIGAIAVPWALDWMNAPTTTATVAVQSAPLPVAPPASSEPPAAPSGEQAGAPVGAVVPPPSSGSPSPQASASDRQPATAVPAPAAEPAKTDATAPKSPPAARAEAKLSDDAAAKKPVRASRAVAQAPAAAGSGAAWWVQVGAFKDAQTAQRVAEKLRAESFQVQETTVTRTATPAARASTPAPAGGAASEQYDVFVTGVPSGELTERLTNKGLASEPSGSGVVVRPSLPLRDAVALSKDLASEGLKVQVRRAGGDAGVSPSAAPAVAGGGETLHRVRVGAFSDRAAATAAMRELESKGFKGFVARGGS